MYRSLRIKQLVLISFILGVFTFASARVVHGQSIFEGFNPGSTGIFGNIGDRIQSIFSGRDIELGGSVVPYNPNAPAPPAPGAPAPPGAGEFIKVWVEWDTFYRGQQPSSIDIDAGDPLEPIHKEYITDRGCCPDCGEVVIENPCDYCDIDQYGNPIRGSDACNQCSDTNSIYHATVDPVLIGWCGSAANIINANSITRTQGQVSTPPTDSPGPNDFILPGSIPNKMIRRDGYVYKCLKVVCEEEFAPTLPPPAPSLPPVKIGNIPEERWNYIEFQTEVYHSNDFVLTLHIQNYGDRDYEENNIRVYRYAEDNKEWPHNIDISDGALGFSTQAGFPARLNKHGNKELAKKESIGNYLQGDDPLTPEIDGEIKDYYQYDPDTVRNRIPGVPIDFNLVGSNIPRDFNFICDKADASEGERCPADMENYSGDDAYLLLERPLTVDEFQQYFFEYRDVSPQDMGGCGYNASSNNSIIGPITYQVEFGGQFEGERHGRSVLNVSIPIGNPVDVEGIPFGWPTTGRIQENWGNTSYAQELGRQRWIEDSRRLYDDYLYCPGEGNTYPRDGRVRAGDFLHPGIDIERATYQIRPPNVYTTHAGFITFAGVDPSYPDKGVTVQVESDINRDHIPDIITRYANLQENSLNIDIRHKTVYDTTANGDHDFKFNESLEFGSEDALYVPRNYLLGVMGDSGAPGNIHLQYEIIAANEDGLPPGANGTIGRERCSDNPYQASCFAEQPGQEMREGNFFARQRYYPELVLGNLFVNP